MAYIPEQYRITPFDSILVSNKTPVISYKPTWGALDTVYDTTLTGSATITGSNGEIKIDTISGVNSSAAIKTKVRGQYQSGFQAEVGFGIRIPEYPSGSQDIKAGYFDSENGFGLGKDSTDLYIFIRKNGVTTKTYQTSWTGYTGSLDDENGIIIQMDFVWYGYGDIRWSALREISGSLELVTLHRINPPGLTLPNPNLPIQFEASNGASSSGSLAMYVGGHQFLINGNVASTKRPFSVPLVNYELQATTDWQPLIAIRKKLRFNGFENSTNVVIQGYKIAADGGDLQVRLTQNATIDSGSWTSPPGWPATETAVETKITSGSAVLSGSVEGYPILHGFIPSTNKNDAGAVAESDRAVLGANTETCLWVRRYNTTGTVTILGAAIQWDEQI